MKNILKTLLSILLIMVLFGCDRKTYYWHFEQSISEIEKISIMYIETFRTTKFEYYTQIKVIDPLHYENLYNDIMEIEMKKRDAMCHPTGYCFVINYKNGNDCFLSVKGSGYMCYNEENEEFSFWYGKLMFDEYSYIFVLNKYLAE